MAISLECGMRNVECGIVTILSAHNLRFCSRYRHGHCHARMPLSGIQFDGWHFAPTGLLDSRLKHAGMTMATYVIRFEQLYAPHGSSAPDD